MFPCYSLVSLSISARSSGYWAVKPARSAISKSAKSKPGARSARKTSPRLFCLTSHPTWEIATLCHLSIGSSLSISKRPRELDPGITTATFSKKIEKQILAEHRAKYPPRPETADSFTTRCR
jgi:hypothetical protein